MKKICTNGCYDILHIGHIKLFEYAKSLGDYLLVCIDSDERVKKLKGDSRPFNNQEDRYFFLKSIKYINDVIIFNSENELCTILKNNSIDSLVIGNEYTIDDIYAKEFVNNVIFFNKIENKSTTGILKYYETYTDNRK